MTEEGATSINYNGGNARWSDIREAWAEMLNAAPPPPEQGTTMKSTDTLYEELRATTDDGDENMTHEGAIEQVRSMREELNQIGAILSNAAGPWPLVEGEPLVVHRLKMLLIDHEIPIQEGGAA